jgi:hypothetical protein
MDPSTTSKHSAFDKEHRGTLDCMTGVGVNVALLLNLYLAWKTLLLHWTPVAPTRIYRRAILQALEGFRDFQSRSNLDSVRRHSRAILESQETDFKWNDTIFLKALKSVVENGEIDLCANIQAELTPTYKRKRADSLTQRMLLTIETELPACPIQDTAPSQYHVPGVSAIRRYSKEPPIRTHEHDKWKVAPKRMYERSPYVVSSVELHSSVIAFLTFAYRGFRVKNPMDTH